MRQIQKYTTFQTLSYMRSFQLKMREHLTKKKLNENKFSISENDENVQTKHP